MFNEALNYAGTVDDDVDLTDGLEQRIDSTVVTYILNLKRNLCVGSVGSGPIYFVLRRAGGNDLCTLGGEGLRDRLADTAAGPGHQHTSLEWPHVTPPLCFPKIADPAFGIVS